MTVVVVEIEAPVGDRSQVLRQAEERQQHVGVEPALVAVEIADDDGSQLAVPRPRRRASW